MHAFESGEWRRNRRPACRLPSRFFFFHFLQLKEMLEWVVVIFFFHSSRSQIMCVVCAASKASRV
ncbi:uncharacterized protein BKA78DRAFT_326482 [Phyllosticta capitalensis]|uniref:uncharacterized protein n=1 Tax=Phyllosticta capitalensis TaxID=121624 RepID=UPI0031321032